MNTAKVHPEDYVQFLLASPVQFTCTEAARVQPEPTAHDSFNRLLTRLEPDPETLWAEARPHIRADDGIWVLDDATLDKPSARHRSLVGWHWSGKHHRPVKGINLLTLVWSDGDRHIPCDYRLYDKDHDGYSKNDLFAPLLRAAKQRGLQPQCLCFDRWYSSLDNLKLIQSLGWNGLGRLKANRKVRVDFERPQAIGTVDIPPQGRVVHRPGYGLIGVFGVVAKNGDTDPWASSDLGMDALPRLRYGDLCWRMEENPRGIKQFCGVERCQARRAKAQRNHIGLSIRAFLRMECPCFALGLSWFQAKRDVIRHAVKAYLAKPRAWARAKPLSRPNWAMA